MRGVPSPTPAEAHTSIRIKRLADATLLVELAAEAGPTTTARLVALTAALDEEAPPGLLDLIPAYTTLLVVFDPVLADPDDLETLILRIAADLSNRPAMEARTLLLPVVYGGDFGPDLADVAAHAGLTVDEVIERHAAPTYLVACLGFAPGFPFLMGLPPELAVPRLTSPRTKTPVGSVAIGGVQTGIYSLETPGGWRVIGRTPIPLFDLADPHPFLLRAGDHLRFMPIPAETYGEIDASVDKRAYVEGRNTPSRNPHPGFDDATDVPVGPIDEPARDGEHGSLSVLEPGLLTTVQDLGRRGLGRYGVSTSGAVDRSALILGNRLVGNAPTAAALEITLIGPRIRFSSPVVVALTGADLCATIDGKTIPRWESIPVPDGAEIAFAKTSSCGLRAYLCVAGGINVPAVFGSRSTDLTGHFGGADGRPLRAGDTLPLGAPIIPPGPRLRAASALECSKDARNVVLRCTLGPQEARFTQKGIDAFLGSQYTVSAKADRMGVRLIGDAVELTNGADMISEGIAPGAVQVPGDGQPIALLTPRHSIGGYPKIATVIGPDLDRLAQVRPGDTVTFTAVTPAASREIALEYHARLGADALLTVPHPVLLSEHSPSHMLDRDGSRHESGEHWNPAGVTRIIEAAQAAKVTALRLEVAGLGLLLELRRESDEADPGFAKPATSEEAASTPDEASPASDDEFILAPMLGVFFRRSGPDQPMMVEQGQPVKPGQAIGLIEVMKTYHEISAPRAGIVVEFLAEDAQFVEYGAPIARLTSAR